MLADCCTSPCRGGIDAGQPDQTTEEGSATVWGNFSRPVERLTVERFGRIHCRIGEAAGVVVQRADPGTGPRGKDSSAHDLRSGSAWRLIDAGVSAVTLKIVMRHASFVTTEKHHGAIRSAQTVSLKIATRTHTSGKTSELLGARAERQNALEATAHYPLTNAHLPTAH